MKLNTFEKKIPGDKARSINIYFSKCVPFMYSNFLSYLMSSEDPRELRATHSERSCFNGDNRANNRQQQSSSLREGQIKLDF